MIINSINKDSVKYLTKMPGQKLAMVRQNIFDSSKQWDICYKYEYPYNVLCNFYPTNFIFDDVEINSMEAFLQSLKFKNPEVQKEICALPGFLAKKAGNYLKRNGQFDREHLYWQGKEFNRNSKEYQKLLNRVYKTKYLYDKEFRSVLESSKGYKLTHIIGKNDPAETILTGDEFIGQLNLLRQKKDLKDFFQIIKADLTKNPHNVKRITDKLNGLKTTFINSKLICGQSPFNVFSQGLSDIKRTGIKNIIDINAAKQAAEQRKSLCKEKRLNYLNFKVDFNDKNNFPYKDITALIKMINSGDISYICCAKREDVNDILILNYLLNPKANISSALIFGTPKKSHLNKIVASIIKCLPQSFKNINGSDNNFIQTLKTRKILLHEINE